VRRVDVMVEIWECWLKFSYLVVDLSPGAQLAEALDVGMNEMDWLETSWSQALLLIHDELYTPQSSGESILLRHKPLSHRMQSGDRSGGKKRAPQYIQVRSSMQ
jgi:hypothetical protein